MKVGTLQRHKETVKISFTDHVFFFNPGEKESDRVSLLGPQRLPPQFDLQSELGRRTWHHDRLRLRGLCKAVVLLFVLLVFFVFAFVDAVQT